MWSAPTSRMTVGLIDADALHRDSLRHSLSQYEQLTVAFAYESPEAIPQTVPQVDLLLFSSSYPSELFGEDLSLAYWLTRFPSTKFFLLTKSRARWTIKALLDAGIHGYGVSDAITLQDLVTLLSRVQQGQQALCAVAASVLTESDKTDIKLTPTEMRIIRTLSEVGTGYGKGKLAANRLGMDQQTFRVHTRNICTKLDVSTASDILPKCYTVGIIENRFPFLTV